MGMRLDGVNVDSILATKHLGSGDNKVIDTFLSTWQPPATPHLLAQTTQTVPQTQASVVESVQQDNESSATPPTVDLQPITMHQSVSSEDTNTETTTFTNILTDPNTIPTPPSNSTTDTTTHSTDNTNNTIATDNTQPSVDSLEVEQEEVFDPQSIVRDILEDDRSGRNLRLCELYNQEKANLIGTSVNTSAGLSWTVHNDVLHSEVVDEYDSLVGVRTLISITNG